jgi:hypothetical protein
MRLVLATSTTHLLDRITRTTSFPFLIPNTISYENGVLGGINGLSARILGFTC